MTSALVLQHIHCEVPGMIANALESRNIAAHYIRTFGGQTVPRELGDFVGLIVMGGPMGVYEHDRYPFLQDEMRLIERALKEERPVLGICLGSQLLASTLGSAVIKGKRKEIGWYPIRLKEAAMTDRLWEGSEPSFVAYHWHGDIFELAQGAVSLASSELTECQAFRYGRDAYGFLFHMEVTQKIIADMVREFSNELEEEGVPGEAIITKAQDHLPKLQQIGQVVFDRWVALLDK
jgi:GMP synthase (glutamine-hydrolysing)